MAPRFVKSSATDSTSRASDPSPPHSDSGSPEPVPTVAKALGTLRTFIDGQDRWGVRELALSLEQPPSSVHRLLARLRMEGYVEFDPIHQKYQIGVEFLRLAAAVLHRDGLRQVTAPMLQGLAARTGESAWLLAWDSSHARLACTAAHDPPQATGIAAPLGRAEGAAEGAGGIVVLAALPEAERHEAYRRAGIVSTPELEREIATVQKQGWAQRALREASAMEVAAAILGHDGMPLGAVVVAVPLHRFGPGRGSLLGSQVRDAAQRTSIRLGARLLGGSAVGSWREAVQLIGDLLQREAPNLMIAPAVGGGGVSNLEDLERGLGAYALATSSSLYTAIGGRAPFRRRLDGLRTVMSLAEVHLLIVARDGVSIGSPSDLARLRVSPGDQGFSSSLVFAALMKMVQASARRPGASARGGVVLHMDRPEAVRQLERSAVDVLFWVCSLSNPLLHAVESAGGTHLCPLEPAMLDALVDNNRGLRRSVVPRDACPGWLEADMPTLADRTVLVCRADRPAEEVEQVARIVFEHRNELAQRDAAYARLDADFAGAHPVVPLHPGAERFLRAAGARL